jgi:predicted nucleotidyltransferase
MVAATLPHGVIERIVEVLDPEEVWLFGSRARETHGPDSDWDLMAVLPNTAPDRQLDIAAVWADLRELRVVVPNVLPLKCASAAMEADARCHRGCGSMATG